MHWNHRIALVLCLPAGLSVLTGCGHSVPQAPLLPSAFINPGVPATAPAASPAATSPAAPQTQDAEPPSTAPTTAPTTAPKPPEHPEAIPVMLAPGQYQTIGGVVSEVNGNPIYANRVLRMLRGEFAARALEMDEPTFRRFAAEEIRKTIDDLERAELRFAAADRTLEEDDRRLAEYLTVQFRTKKITDAGGSVELARRKAAEDGDDFEQLIYDQYRKYMTDIFYRRKVFPRIQVSANDLRAYYNLNVDREFTQIGEVTFRLIKIDPRMSGGRDAALARAQEIAQKASTGDFAELARTMNHDDRLARAGGQETPIQRGAYRLEKLEEALWETPAGSITPVIEDSGAFYIAKVEKRTQNMVLPFEEREVQAKIRRTLESRQFTRMSDEIDAELRRNSMVRKNPEMAQAALDLAMQGYAIWNRGS